MQGKKILTSFVHGPTCILLLDCQPVAGGDESEEGDRGGVAAARPHQGPNGSVAGCCYNTKSTELSKVSVLGCESIHPLYVISDPA